MLFFSKKGVHANYFEIGSADQPPSHATPRARQRSARQSKPPSFLCLAPLPKKKILDKQQETHNVNSREGHSQDNAHGHYEEAEREDHANILAALLPPFCPIFIAFMHSPIISCEREVGEMDEKKQNKKKKI